MDYSFGSPYTLPPYIRFRRRKSSHLAVLLCGMLFVLYPSINPTRAEGLMPALPPSDHEDKKEAGKAKTEIQPKSQAETKPTPTPSTNPTVSIIVSGEPFAGELVPPATDSGFSFRLKETGDKITISWRDLKEDERKRIRGLFGIPAGQQNRPANSTNSGTPSTSEAPTKWGKEITIVRLTLKGGRTVEGVELPRRAKVGHRCLQSATMVIQVPKKNIQSESFTKKRESDLYTPEAVYDRMILENPPRDDSAQDHMRLIPDLIPMGLYDKALAHLYMAHTIDPRTKERTVDLEKTLLANLDGQVARKLHKGILRDMNRQNFIAALEKLNRFARNFPEHPLLANVEIHRPLMERNRDRNFKKYVVKKYYALAHILIRKKMSQRVKVDQQGNPVPPLPGKQISLQSGKMLRGTLTEEKEDAIVITQNDEEFEIKRKDIVHIRDVDLSKGVRTIPATYSFLQSYITGGLDKDIIAQITQELKSDEASVKAAWDGRFQKRTVIEDGVRKSTPSYTSVREAFYGAGTWLRSGVKGGSKKIRTKTRNKPVKKKTTYNGKKKGDSGSTTTLKRAPDKRAEAMASSNPEIWWSVQRSETKSAILEAMAAEALFKVRSEKSSRCPTCGGRGILEQFGSTGTRSQSRCPTCRGQKTLLRIMYE